MDNMPIKDLNMNTVIYFHSDCIIVINCASDDEQWSSSQSYIGEYSLELPTRSSGLWSHYRIGPTKPVKVYKFICSSTIETYIQSQKLQIANNILDGCNIVEGTKKQLQTNI